MRRRYPPYSKWLGRAVARSPGGAGLGAPPAAALAATGWPARERQLGLAYQLAAEAHNRLGLTEPLDPGTRPYYSRPYRVIDSTPALGDLRYPRAVTSVSDRDAPVLGVSDTQT